METLYPKVKIILVSYHQEKILDKVIRQLNKVTKYPNFEIIIADNRSENSDKIKNLCANFIAEGLISKAYFFKRNLMGNATRYVVMDNLDCDYITWGDYDAYILDPKDESCWLSDFIDCLKNDERALMLQFSAINNPLFRRGLPEIEIDSSNTWTVNGTANGHYLTVRKEFFIDYVTSFTYPLFVDGNFMIFTEAKKTSDGINYYRKRYDKNSVINLSSESCGISNLDNDIIRDQDYLMKRERTLSGGLNEEGIGFLTYVPVDSSMVEIIE